MKVCFVNILYSKKAVRGGLGSHIADLSAELAKRGHEVTVITSGEKKQYEVNGVKVIQLGELDKYSRPSQLFRPGYIARRIAYMLRMTRYVLRADFDIVEAADGGFEQLFLLLHRKCPLVTKLHGGFRFIYSNQNPLAYFMDRLESLAIRKSDGIYTSSSAYAKSIASDYQLPLERIKIIPYGIDVRGMQGEKLDLEQNYPGIKGKKIVLLSVGSSPVRKGARAFIDVAAQVKQNGVLFILLCSDRQFLGDTTAPDNLLVLENLDRRQFYSLISRSDIIVFPSQFESFSIATYEAMLLNKTIIVSENIPLEGLASEYPRCYTLQKIDATLLAEAILEVLDGRKKFPENNGELIQRLREEYDISRVARSTEKFYEEVIEKFKRNSKV